MQCSDGVDVVGGDGAEAIGVVASSFPHSRNPQSPNLPAAAPTLKPPVPADAAQMKRPLQNSTWLPLTRVRAMKNARP